MNSTSHLFLFLLSLYLFSCKNSSPSSFLKNQILKEIPIETNESGEPNLVVSKNGQVYLSWVEYLNDTTDALLFSKLENNKWTTPQKIAEGTNWFVNWADFPSLVAYHDGKTLAAHWLQKSATGTYDYDIHIAQSSDEGKTWDASFILHRDSIAAEHGFVSMLPFNDSKVFVTWLDGRNTKAETPPSSNHKGHGHHGAMTLRSAIFDKNGNLFKEEELDNRICDCCQTSAALTDEGVVVVYRDRSEKEIRDISIVRQVKGKWTTPKTIYDENWEIAGCPVNGPSIDAIGKNVAVAWYTSAEEKPTVKVAFSQNSAANFTPPVRVDEGKPLGRVDVVMTSEKTALVSWLEQDGDNASVKIVQVNAEGRVGASFEIATTKSARQSGFPRMVKNENQIIFAWTAVDSLTKIKSGVIELK